MVRVLIIDDDHAKAAAIQAVIAEVSSSRPVEVAQAASLSESVRLVTGTRFDLIILDLMLPYIADGQPDARAGLEMLRTLRREDGPNSGTAVIGLSAFPDEVRDSRELFENAGVLIVCYEESGAWRQSLQHSLVDVIRQRSGRMHVDFVILTALDEERAGFSGTELVHEADSIVAGLNVNHVHLPTKSGVLRGALIKLRQMGLTAATLDASLAISAFETKVICMSGICAGFTARAEMGQLVVASPAWEYQAGKWSSDGFQIAPNQIPLPAGTRVVLDQIAKQSEFHAAIESGISRNVRRPSIWHEPTLAPAATGSAVIADRSKLHHIEQQHRKVAALDMETFGIYYAAHEATPPIEHYFSVKCVVDLADDDKDDDLHEYGCAASARAVIFMLRRILE